MGATHGTGSGRGLGSEQTRQIGQEIRRLRIRAGLSQREAAEQALGLREHQGLWSRWERGLVRPNIGTLDAIARWGGVPLSSFGLFDDRAAADRVEAVREVLRGALVSRNPGPEIRRAIDLLDLSA